MSKRLEHYRELTKEFILSVMNYDAENGLLYWKPNDILNNRGKDFSKPIGHTQNDYATFRIHGKRFAVHRIIYFLETGEIPEIVDHIDRNIFNNHISNLRASNFKNNRMNTNDRRYEIATRLDGTKSYIVRYYGDNATRQVATYKNETIAKFAAWWLRELMFPGVVEAPEFSEDEENAIIRIMENYTPL